MGLKKHHYEKRLVEVIEFQLNYFKSSKMMLWKCCTQYTSKFGKLSSGHRTGNGQSSSQFPRRAELKNVHTTRQWPSPPMLVRLCSKSSELAFSSMWTKGIQMFKLNLKRQRNQRSNCQNSLDHRESKGIQKNICFVDYTGAFDCVDYNKLWKTLKEMGIPDHLTCLLRNLYASQEATVRSLVREIRKIILFRLQR